MLRYYEDLDDATIAEILDCSPVTVRTHAMRGLATLRERHGVTQPTTKRERSMTDVEEILGHSLRERAAGEVATEAVLVGAVRRGRGRRARRRAAMAVAGAAAVLVAAGAVERTCPAGPTRASAGGNSGPAGCPTPSPNPPPCRIRRWSAPTPPCCTSRLTRSPRRRGR